MKNLCCILLLPLLVAASAVPNLANRHVAPISSRSEGQSGYIVIFKRDITATAATAHYSRLQELQHISKHDTLELRTPSQFPLAEEYPDGVERVFDLGDKHVGYSGVFTDAVVKKIRKDPNVEIVEADSLVTAQANVHEGFRSNDIQSKAPWGLARISHRSKLTFGNLNQYVYDKDAGKGVTVYDIGTGINTDHAEFEGRAAWGTTITRGDVDEDGNGHGTHCAGTIAGQKYGVAKKAIVTAIKVLRGNGSGTMADVIAGLIWTAKSHAREAAYPMFKGSVAHLGLSGGMSQALGAVLDVVMDAGVQVVLAAGNDNKAACFFPAGSSSRAVVAAASTLDDKRADFSNHGSCVDIFGPGSTIQSAYIGSEHATRSLSGTSMASAHVAGVLAYIMSLEPVDTSAYSVADPNKWKKLLLSIATRGVLTELDSETPNLLAFNNVAT